jgi:hypothetical protein
MIRYFRTKKRFERQRAIFDSEIEVLNLKVSQLERAVVAANDDSNQWMRDEERARESADYWRELFNKGENQVVELLDIKDKYVNLLAAFKVLNQKSPLN